MSNQSGFAEKCAHLLHKYFIWIVVASYGAAAFMPQLGETLRSWRFLNTSMAGMSIFATTPTILLAMLLFNASLVANIDELKTIARRPVLALGSLVGNFASPLAFIFVSSVMLRFWHNSDEPQQLLTGLVFVAAMPIAGASTAWAQSANGNMSLSVGLVMATTLFSPALTPLVLHAAGAVTTGDYSEDLHEIAAGESANFLCLWVLAPSLLGLAAGRALSDKRAAAAKPYLKIANYSAPRCPCPESCGNPTPTFWFS
ncbi:MAG: Na+-dependent [Methylocystaceae bacterium]|nr:MAG: Na+-dependent [Methylocystaceae bacterium]